MADLPLVIAVALGGAAVGGPEALILLLDVAGRYPAADVIIVFFLSCATTSFVLGTMLLARYMRVAVANDAAALEPGTARFAKVTLAVGLAVVIIVAACLLAIPSVPAGAPAPPDNKARSGGEKDSGCSTRSCQ